MLTDEIIVEVNRVCDSCCYKQLRTDCPYAVVCGDTSIDEIEDEHERTAAFENAIVRRYYEIHKGDKKT